MAKYFLKNILFIKNKTLLFTEWLSNLYMYIISCLTVVEGDPKAPFLISTILSCRRGHYSFRWIAPPIFVPFLIMLSVKQGSIKYHFLESLNLTRYGIEPQSPAPLANTLPIMPMHSLYIVPSVLFFVFFFS